MPKKLTRARILLLAQHHEFHVHKYRDGVTYVRKLTRRMAKEGLLVMVRQDNDYFYYRVKV